MAPEAPHSSDANGPREDINALRFPEMQKVDEHPVLGQLVAIAAVDIDHPEFACFAGCRHPHEAAGGPGGEAWPAEKPAIGAFGEAADMGAFAAVGKAGAEGAGMLAGIARD